jgi:hypothetical protein
MASTLDRKNEPAWAESLRREGYRVRTGTGELSKVPEFTFTPPPRARRRSPVSSVLAFLAGALRKRDVGRIPSHKHHAPIP